MVSRAIDRSTPRKGPAPDCESGAQYRDDHRKRNAEETDALIAILRDATLACHDNADRDTRLTAVEGILLPDAENIVHRCDAHAALAGNNYLPLLSKRTVKPVLPRLLSAVRVSGLSLVAPAG
jgi:hypothetical protein